MMALQNISLAALLALAGCGGDDSGGADATTDATTADSSTTDAGGDGGGTCTDYTVGRLCVRGAVGDTGEMLTSDSPVRFMLEPDGCHSSACTFQEIANCSATVSGSMVAVEGRFCLRTEGECTLPDCSGGGIAECMTADNLPDGEYTATLGDLSVSFTIPSMVDFGGACDGSPAL